MPLLLRFALGAGLLPCAFVCSGSDLLGVCIGRQLAFCGFSRRAKDSIDLHAYVYCERSVFPLVRCFFLAACLCYSGIPSSLVAAETVWTDISLHE